MRNTLLLSTLLLSVLSNAQNEINVSLNYYGKPNYQKELNIDMGLIIYQSDNYSFAQILPREYYNLGNQTDTLTLIINKNPENTANPNTVECRNCGDISFTHLIKNDTNFFTFSFNEDFIRFIATFEKNPREMYSAPLLVNESRDTLIGYIRLKNTFIHYSPLIAIPNINIGLIDKNFNGRIDSTDFVAISNDEFFFTAKNERANEVRKVKIIEVQGVQYLFNFSDDNTLKINLTRIEKKAIPDLIFSDSLRDLKFGEKSLYKALDSSDYVLLAYWSEFCPPCVKNIPKLNKIPKNVQVIGLYSGRIGLDKLAKTYTVKYYNIVCSEELKDALTFNGFPYYVLIDKNKRIVLNTRNLDEILKFI
jgi:thiol-disulfide isomerase/thioredoxin